MLGCMSMPQTTEFGVDQRIVYPSQGVGRITEIREKRFKETTVLYYVVYLEFSDMTVWVPVEKARELGIRPIVPKEEAERALAFISEEYAPIPTDWKLRYQMNLELLKKGSVMDIASVVRSLYHRSKIKELPILERKLYDSALNLLQDEISFSLDLNKDEIAELIRARLEA
ncbi:MAG: CarD family transcriptional regulator [Spirochaetota bacterium]